MTALLTPDRHETRSSATSTYAFPSARAAAVRDANRPAVRPDGRPALVVLEGGRASSSPERRVYLLRRSLAVLALGAVIVALLWGIVSLGAPPAPVQHGTPARVTSTRYVVRPGDSLWGIAESLHAGGDVRDVVDRLAAINGSDTVVSGQAITIPADLVH